MAQIDLQWQHRGSRWYAGGAKAAYVPGSIVVGGVVFASIKNMPLQNVFKDLARGCGK